MGPQGRLLLDNLECSEDLLGLWSGLGLGLDLHFAVWVSVSQSIFMQLLSARGERES